MRISIPRWVQLILIPLAIVFALYFGRAASHAVFVFLMSAIVALLLNPLAMAAGRIKCPRWLAVPLVYIVFIAAIVLIFVYLGPPLIDQLQKLFDAIPEWLDTLNDQLADLERWLATSKIQANLQINTGDIGDWFKTHGAESVGAIISVGRGVVSAVVNLFLTVVVSFYMLIDGKRIYRWLCSLVPGDQNTKESYVRGFAAGLQPLRQGAVLLGVGGGLLQLAGPLDLQLEERRHLAGRRSVGPALRGLGGGHRSHTLRRTFLGRGARR